MACFPFYFIAGSYRVGVLHLLLGCNEELDQRVGLCQENTERKCAQHVHLERTSSEKLKLGLKQSSGRWELLNLRKHSGKKVGMAGKSGERTRSREN